MLPVLPRGILNRNDYYYGYLEKSGRLVTLSNLKVGDRATITLIDAEEPLLVAKCAARGLVPGISVGIVRDGDPVLISVDDVHWAINRPDAACIHVEHLRKPRRSLFNFLFCR